jgi:hypothetical protein
LYEKQKMHRAEIETTWAVGKKGIVMRKKIGVIVV